MYKLVCLRASFHLVAWTLLDNSGKDFKGTGKLQWILFHFWVIKIKLSGKTK